MAEAVPLCYGRLSVFKSLAGCFIRTRNSFAAAAANFDAISIAVAVIVVFAFFYQAFDFGHYLTSFAFFSMPDKC
mgnify:FL=1